MKEGGTVTVAGIQRKLAAAAGMEVALLNATFGETYAGHGMAIKGSAMWNLIYNPAENGAALLPVRYGRKGYTNTHIRTPVNSCVAHAVCVCVRMYVQLYVYVYFICVDPIVYMYISYVVVQLQRMNQVPNLDYVYSLSNTVSRDWNFAPGPANDDWTYAIFDWDNIFASLLAGLGNKTIAYVLHRGT